MIEQAFTHGWITDDEQRRKLREEMERIILDEKSSKRDKVAATKAVLAAERLHVAERELLVKEKLMGSDDDGSILGLVSKIMELKAPIQHGNEQLKLGDE